MFKRILIANRGEIAVRICRTCQEMSVATVAVHSDIDRRAPHVLAADRAMSLAGDEPADSYLNVDKIIAAARETGCEAIHPGYGFLSESAAFAARCAAEGLVFIGPAPDTLRQLGDKAEARHLAVQLGVPVLPGTERPTDDVAVLEKEAREIGLPLMVKAAAGGGGKGMRRVDAAGDLAESLRRATSEARAAFGDGSLYLERCVDRPRHVEVQILGDGQGNAVHLFERECSIQRRHQKLVEEAPCPAVDAALRARLGEAAVTLARKAGYQGAGTVEFLLAPDGTYTFMEVNARLQVEHPVTEFVTGLDLVRLQLEIAAGATLPFAQNELTLTGHALECRLYAENPADGFAPSPGDIVAFRAPSGPGVRFDGGIEAGSAVPVFYDPILAKLICWAPDRAAAIARMDRALGDTEILGVTHTGAILRDVVTSEAFRRGETHTAFLAEHLPDWQPAGETVDAALCAWLAADLEGLAGRDSAAGRVAIGAARPGDPWDTLGGWRLEGKR